MISFFTTGMQLSEGRCKDARMSENFVTSEERQALVTGMPAVRNWPTGIYGCSSCTIVTALFSIRAPLIFVTFFLYLLSHTRFAHFMTTADYKLP